MSLHDLGDNNNKKQNKKNNELLNPIAAANVIVELGTPNRVATTGRILMLARLTLITWTLNAKYHI